MLTFYIGLNTVFHVLPRGVGFDIREQFTTKSCVTTADDRIFNHGQRCQTRVRDQQGRRYARFLTDIRQLAEPTRADPHGRGIVPVCIHNSGLFERVVV